jgi:hypothetical protein
VGGGLGRGASDDAPVGGGLWAQGGRSPAHAADSLSYALIGALSKLALRVMFAAYGANHNRLVEVKLCSGKPPTAEASPCSLAGGKGREPSQWESITQFLAG